MTNCKLLLTLCNPFNKNYHEWKQFKNMHSAPKQALIVVTSGVIGLCSLGFLGTFIFRCLVIKFTGRQITEKELQQKKEIDKSQKQGMNFLKPAADANPVGILEENSDNGKAYLDAESSTKVEPSEQQDDDPAFAGRIVQLPADDKYRKVWEFLGVKWLESLDEEPLLAKALLPEGWKIEKRPSLYSDHHDISIIDGKGQEQAKMWIKTAFWDEAACVSFPTIDQELLEQMEKKEEKVIEDDFKPVCYPGYTTELYCSYDEIIEAIEPWGKVEAILMNSSGLNHTFVVRFKRPIKFSSYGEGIMVNLTGGGGIWHTPFSLRGVRPEGELYKKILSNNMMAFDILCLGIGFFSASELDESTRLLPDERFDQIKKKAGEHANWKKVEKAINATFSESDKAKKLLEWIKQSGLSILEKGLYRNGDDPIGECTIEEIIADYTTPRGYASPWQVVMKA